METEDMTLVVRLSLPLYTYLGAFREKKIQRKLNCVNLLRPFLFKYITFSFLYCKRNVNKYA